MKNSSSQNIEQRRVRGHLLVTEGADLLRLAGPLIMAALLNMGISITDVFMMGWLGPTELGAGAVISDYHSIVFYLTAGIVAAAAPMIAHARGSRDLRTVRWTMQQTLWLSLPLALTGATLIWISPSILALLGVHPDILDLGGPYARMIALAYVPMLLAMVWRHLLSAHDLTRAVFVITAIALPINAVGNYLLMFGKFGFPAMGLAGAGLSSFIVTLFVLIASVWYSQQQRVLRRYRLFQHISGPDHQKIISILRLGVPIGLSGLGETGVFLLATVAMGIIGPEALAAHAVTLRIAGVIYAFPLGLSQAATVRIGYVAGRGDFTRLTRVVQVAIILAIIVGVLYLFGLTLWRAQFTSVFLDAGANPTVFSLATIFIVVMAIGQPFECTGTVGAGILRGVKEASAPMRASLISFWGVGFLTAFALTFTFQFGGLGIWIGLTLGSFVFGTLIMLQLMRAFRKGPIADLKHKATAQDLAEQSG